MNKILFILFLMFTLTVPNAESRSGEGWALSSLTIPHDVDLPVGCGEGDAFYDMDATAGQQFYICDDSQTWVLQSAIFDPTSYGNTTWGSGSAFTWTMNSGTTDPLLAFGNGTTTLSDSSFVIAGANSQMTGANGMYINFDTARKMKWGSTGGTYNEDLSWDNDTTTNTWTVTSSTGASSLLFDSIGIGALNSAIGSSYYNRVTPTSGAIIQGNVGIGTFTPSSKLQVVGTVTATAFVGDGSGLTGISGGSGGWTDGGTNVYTSTTTDNVGIGTTTPSNVLDVAGGAPRFRTLTNCDTMDTDANGVVSCGTDSGSASGWTDGGTNVYTTSTTDNVGIGTTTPTATLMIENVSTGDSFRVSDSVADASPFIITSNGNVGIGTTAPATPFQVGSGASTERFSIASVANPTLALRNDTTSSTDLFNIQGSALASGNALDVSSSASSTFVVPLVRFVTSGANMPYPTLLVQQGGLGEVVKFNDVSGDTTPFVVNAGGNVGIGTINPVGQLDIRFQTPTPPLMIGNSATDATGGYMIMTSTGNVGIGTINPVGGFVVMNGNAGIGTWSPTAKLQVVGTVAATAFTGDGSALTGISGGTGGWTDGGTNVYATSSTDNVGIGTTTPTSGLKLDVRGAIGATSYVGIGTTQTQLSFIEASANGTNAIMITAPSAITSDVNCVLENDSSPIPDSCVGDGVDDSGSGGWTDNGATISTTTSSDNVGIGSVNPEHKLVVSSTASNIAIKSTDSAEFGGFKVINDTADELQVGLAGSAVSGEDKRAYIYNTANASLEFGTNDTGRMFISGGGNVGIGTINPANGSLHMPANGTATGKVLCFGTNNCVGYCTSLTAATGICSSCTCF